MITLGHHWAVSMRGGERVLESLSEIYPEAPIYTLVANREKLSATLKRADIRTSLLQKIPGSSSIYPWFLVLHPLFFRQMKVPGSTSIFVCSDASFAKAIRTPPNAIKICYCHSPPRYLWGQHKEYLNTTRSPANLLLRLGLTLFGGLLRFIDRSFTSDFDVFLSNSEYVAKRIKRCYGIDAQVVYPPVEIDRFNPTREREDFFLIVSQLESYKRIELVVDAFRNLEDKLIVVGEGSLLKRLCRSAPPNVSFTGRISDEEVTNLMERTRALIFPGIDDFGMTPVEANAAGAPVIAFGGGGALETVIAGETGIFFSEHTSDSIREAISEFKDHEFSPSQCRENAERFQPKIFTGKLSAIIDNLKPNQDSNS